MKKLILAMLAWALCAVQVSSDDAASFPPVPSWKPDFAVSNDTVLERMAFYTNGAADLVVFKHGTTVVLPSGLSDEDARAYAAQVLAAIFNAHPDFKPLSMKDGNILVTYNHPAFNVVVTSFVDAHLEIIMRKHLDALATDEVLITGNGPNKFNLFDMKALYGRTFMFVDAQNPEIAILHRANVSD